RHGAAPIRGAGPHTERISGTPPRVALDMRPRRFDIQRAANPPGRAALVASRNGTAPETGIGPHNATASGIPECSGSRTRAPADTAASLPSADRGSTRIDPARIEALEASTRR